ncbi:MAG: Na+-translocating decarboxylase subunit beta [Verrucomicrobia bacterium GWC2_42_7]|nr:MAG: Na+-translocating decarboxylase subunit beta [Verrucomicrobia bacterium GWC2_42_7]
MEHILDIFQGVQTLMDSSLVIGGARIFLMLFGIFLIYMGYKEVLEPLLMIPMGLGMLAVNAGVLYLDGHKHGTLFVDPLVSDYGQLMNILQIDFLQPIYTLTFSNGLIACFVFMGIGSLLDVGYVMARPFESMFLALCAELGTVATYPIAVAAGLSFKDAASIAMVGGADGPMVLYTSLMLSKDLFVPITVVAYLYLGLTYGAYPYLIKLLVPKHILAKPIPEKPKKPISSGSKLAFSVVCCGLLCLLFPVAAPLFLSLFLGVAVRESKLSHFVEFISGPLLYGSTLFLGLTLGILCEAKTILDPKILILLCLGMLSLLLSGIGGILGGYILYFLKKGKYNPAVGIAGVSCVPTTAKVVQKLVNGVAPEVLVLPQALGANICGIITTAILCGIYVALLR